MNQEQSKAVLAAYQTSSRGATGIARTIMLYDQITVRLVEAKAKWESSVFDGAFAAIKEAAGIVAELSASLDDSKGEQVCKTLRRFYVSLSFQVLAVPRQSDPAARLDSLLRQVQVVRDAWVQVLAQGEAGQPLVVNRRKESIGISLA